MTYVARTEVLSRNCPQHFQSFPHNSWKLFGSLEIWCGKGKCDRAVDCKHLSTSCMEVGIYITQISCQERLYSKVTVVNDGCLWELEGLEVSQSLSTLSPIYE